LGAGRRREPILKQDRFRITAFGGHGTVGYDIFGVGNAGGDQGQTIPIRQGGSLVLLEVLFRLKGKFYLGRDSTIAISRRAGLQRQCAPALRLGSK